jgi:hypothetical protein
MLNVNAITSTLAKMPDAALQKYAALHKEDPYIMALAVSESNRRKEMRSAAQAPQGMGAQPKVADQAVAEMAPQMLPEEQGIGQLPAGNMNFAGGGIIAFADGGDVERYQAGGAPMVPPNLAQFSAEEMARLYRIDPRLARAAVEGLKGRHAAAMAGPFGATTVGGLILSAEAAKTLGGMTPEQREQFYSSPLMGAQSGDAGLAAAIMNAPNMEQPTMSYGQQMQNALTTPPRMLVGDPALASERAARQAAEAKKRPLPGQNVATSPAANYQRTDPRAAQFNIPSIAEQAAEVTAGVSGAGAEGQRDPAVRAPGADASRANAPAAAAAAPAPAAPNLDATQMMKDAIDAAGKKANPFAAQIEGLGKERVTAKEEEVTGLKAIQEKFNDIYKGRRERLDTREAELGKMKDQHMGLALLQAGAAMMSTPGGLGRALGKGAQVGTEQYAAGLEKLQAAKDKLSDARDRLEEVEAQRGELSARELFKANNEVKIAGINAREDMIKSNMQMYGLNREEAMKIVDAQVRIGVEQYSQAAQTERTRMDIASRERTARISAGAPSAQMQMAAALGGGNSPEQLAKGLQKMNEAATGKTDMRTLYATYLSGAQKNPGSEVLSYSQFVGQFAIPTTSGDNPAAAAPGTDRARPPGT